MKQWARLLKTVPDTFYFDTFYLLHDTARTFVEASLREKNLEATVAAIRRGLFLRFYGHEFDAPTRDRILAAIERACFSGTMVPGTIFFIIRR